MFIPVGCVACPVSCVRSLSITDSLLTLFLLQSVNGTLQIVHMMMRCKLTEGSAPCSIVSPLTTVKSDFCPQGTDVAVWLAVVSVIFNKKATYC